MGGKCCERPEQIKDEEYITSMISNLALTKLKAELLYNSLLDNFDNCSIEQNIDKFINNLVGNGEDNEYYEEQYKYFSHLFTFKNKIVKTIGLIIIFNSCFDNIIDRQQLLISHVIQFYGKEQQDIKEFIQDLIYINTIAFLSALKEKIDISSYYENMIWSSSNRLKQEESLFQKYKNISKEAHDLDPIDIIPKAMSKTKKDKKEKKKNLNSSFASTKSNSSTNNISKIFEEDKEMIIKKFIIDSFISFQGKEIRKSLTNII